MTSFCKFTPLAPEKGYCVCTHNTPELASATNVRLLHGFPSVSSPYLQDYGQARHPRPAPLHRYLLLDHDDYPTAEPNNVNDDPLRRLRRSD